MKHVTGTEIIRISYSTYNNNLKMVHRIAHDSLLCYWRPYLYMNNIHPITVYQCWLFPICCVFLIQCHHHIKTTDFYVINIWFWFKFFQDPLIQNTSIEGCLMKNVMPLSESGLTCSNSSKILANTTEDSHTSMLFVPYPESGVWYVGLIRRCYNSSLMNNRWDNLWSRGQQGR